MKKNKNLKSHFQKCILCSFTALLLLLGLITEKQADAAEPDNNNTTVATLNSKKPNPSEDHIDRD
ncbi:MAG: hypothetical protein K2N63_13165 [Lachnospiraceae bacterium]|nr:hypothetical protein [Lachnospiraceae bacterium]